MGRRLFSREFKLEAVRLVRERGVSVVQAAREVLAEGGSCGLHHIERLMRSQALRREHPSNPNAPL